ncbi:MAG TPA: ferredoxin--nitrite reductase [Ruminococcaceae bacterium]|mgnify:CR=1 FL=1|nr:ferredoxin--nitrite reductase [Oscillospiraceae bacterium]
MRLLRFAFPLAHEQLIAGGQAMATPLEAYKAELNFKKINALISHYQENGWDTLTRHDTQALKYVGIFARPKTPGYFMIRVRIPGGILKASSLSAAQMHALVDITRQFGRDILDLTTRQQIQLRWIKAKDIPEVLTLLNRAGLTTYQTGFDNLRNITTCAAAGLDADEILDTRKIVEEINTEILGNWSVSNLPRKFNMTISGCHCDCTHGEINDIALMPAEKEGAFGFNVLVGGALGAWGQFRAVPLDAFVKPSEAKELCLTILRLYKEKGEREMRGRSRLKFLIEALGIDTFRQDVAAHLSFPLPSAGTDLTKPERHHDHIGVHPQKTKGFFYIGLNVPAGRLTLDQANSLVHLAEKYGHGEIRLTTAQNILLTDIPEEKLDALLAEPLLRELSPKPSPFLRGLTACAGNTFCAFARINTKKRALELTHYLDTKLETADLNKLGHMEIHASGCSNSCANPWVGQIGLIGKKIKKDEGFIEGADICLGGEAGLKGNFARLWKSNIPFTEIGPLLVTLLQNFLHEKKEQESFRQWCLRSHTISDE